MISLQVLPTELAPISSASQDKPSAVVATKAQAEPAPQEELRKL